MQIQMECKNCGQMCVTDLGIVVAAMIDTIDNDSVYGGYFCRECAEDMFDEED